MLSVILNRAELLPKTDEAEAILDAATRASELTRQAVGAQAARAGVAAADAAQTLGEAAANASRDLRSSVAGAARRVHHALGALDLSAAAQNAATDAATAAAQGAADRLASWWRGPAR